jgi:hypothetical protein
MKLESSRQSFEKFSNIKFHENPSIGSQVISCGRTDRQTDGRTDLTKLTVAFCNFANGPNKEQNDTERLSFGLLDEIRSLWGTNRKLWLDPLQVSEKCVQSSVMLNLSNIN